MIDFLNEYWWFAIILYVVLFLGDHFMSVVLAKLYKAYGAQYFTYQNGPELNPIFEKEVANLQWFTWKHLIAILGGIFSLYILRLLGGKAIFEFFIGAFLLQWLYIDLSHIASILYYQDIRRPGSLTGKMEFSYWLSQRQVAFRSMSQAFLFSVAALVTMRLFFWGGVAGLLFQSFRHLRLANRNFTQTSNVSIHKASE
jgi:hypothetical protein